MKNLLALLLLLWSGYAFAASPCPATVGTLTLRVYQPRTSCVSPCLLFFDATGSPQYFQSAAHTTDTATLTGVNNVVQDVSYSWNFGDPNASGTGTWMYGSRPNQNSKDVASGPVAAHLYVLPTNGTADLTTNVQVWAYDGTNMATCTVNVTVYAPSGISGFSGSSTTCVAASSIPVAGAGGCPAGAGVMQQSNFATALTSKLGGGRRVLFKCGDTFTGSGAFGGSTTLSSIGAYGGCENTTSNRPRFQNSSGETMDLQGTDMRVADLDFEDGTDGVMAIRSVGDASQTTIYNVNCSGVKQCVYSGNATQFGIIQTTASTHGIEGTFLNTGGSQCLGAESLYCGAGSYSQSNYHNVSYTALLGDVFNNNGYGGETVRIGACRMCVISNSVFENSAISYSPLKIHEGQSDTTWNGQYTELLEISDNLFTGTSGGEYLETRPQNTVRDERGRYIIVERNLFKITNGQSVAWDQGWSNVTGRNNVFYSTTTDSPTVAWGIAVGKWCCVNPTANEMYNNTMYFLEATTSGGVRYDSSTTGSFAANNLMYTAGGTNQPTVVNNGPGNTVGNNTANSTVNFQPTNGSGTFTSITDFKPTTAYTGATASVPNHFDAFGYSWIGAYTLGALSQAVP